MTRVLLLADKLYPHSVTGLSSYQWSFIKALTKVPKLRFSLITTAHSEINLRLSLKYNHELRNDFLDTIRNFNNVLFVPIGRSRSFRLKFIMWGRLVTGLNDSFDVIHVLSGNTSLIYLLLNKCDMKVMKHIAYPASILELLQMRITASLYKAARKRLFHVVTSEYLVRKIRSISGKVLIPPAVDTELFKPSGINERKSSKILYIGPLTPSRFPYFTVLRALKKLNTDYGKDVELNVGVAPWRLSREKVYLKEMTNYAAKLGLREKLKILVRGFMPKEKVDLYNCSDVIIQFYLEPLDFIPVDPPITVLEAMSCEKPVVVTKSLSLPNFINSGYNGFLLARVREKELAEALSEALDRKHCIGSNARNTIVKKFSIERVSSSLKKLYDNLI